MIYPWIEPVFRQLVSDAGRRHHALLLTGPAGIGKQALALALARSRLCEQPLADGAACRRCAACGWFDAGNHPDFRHLAPAGEGSEGADGEASGSTPARPARGASGRTPRGSREIRIDQVRALDGFLDVAAHRAGSRVILVEPADAMNTVAANALLKRLEEPPPGAGFILVTSRPAALPATIRSRCRRFSLGLPARGSARDWLAADLGLSAEQADGWLAAAGGAPLHARELAADTKAGNYRRIVDAFAGLPEAGIVATADALSGVDPLDWAGAAQTWAADLARVCAGANPRRHIDRHERLNRLAGQTRLGRVTQLERRLRTLAWEAPHPLNPRLLLEDILLEYHRALVAPATTPPVRTRSTPER
ncbi:MAG: DNA polymerase III subunit delta' [Burkholderiaceae bacterium]